MCQHHTRRSLPTSRREILKLAAAGAGIALLGPRARGWPVPPGGAPLRPNRRLVVIYCYGGYDGLNMLVPVTNSAYYSRRPTIGINPAGTLPLLGTSDYALHSAFVNVATLFNQDQCVAAVRKVGYPSANLSHFTSQDIYSLGVRGSFASLNLDRSGWIARYADAFAQDATGVVAVGVGRPLDVSGGSTNPFMVDSLQNFAFQVDTTYPSNHIHRIDSVRRILAAFAGSGHAQDAAVALSQGHTFADQVQAAVQSYQPAPGVSYPTTSPGRYLKDVATLIHAGFSTSVFFTGFGGWDTHGNQGAATGAQASLIGRLDLALAAFVADLRAMNAWDDTVIVVVSEFGRRNFENSSGGTDHGHGNNFFALGGRVVGGLYGPDILESDIAGPSYLDFAVDFRDIYKEVLVRHFGVDPALVFPEPQSLTSTLGFLP